MTKSSCLDHYVNLVDINLYAYFMVYIQLQLHPATVWETHMTMSNAQCTVIKRMQACLPLLRVSLGCKQACYHAFPSKGCVTACLSQ